ncbi:sensor histidine kinase [Euzebya sp.]|uniref:sensor histidine kinase n=1 Tax=Euzebya sp. TaxID=1971409 RepID=UPI0035127EEB
MERITPWLQRVGAAAFTAVVAVGAVAGLVLDVVVADGWTVAPLASLVAAATLLMPRRRDIGLAVAVTAGITASLATIALGFDGLPGFTEMGALLVLVGGTVRHATPAVAVAGVTAALLDTGVMALRASGPLGSPGSIAVSLWLLVVIAVAVGFYYRYLDEMAARESASARREERLALARELHDTVAHHVTGIVVQAQAAQVVTRSRRPVDPAGAAVEDVDPVLDALAAIERSGAETMAAMRRFVGSLRADPDAPLAPTAGLDDLRRLVADVSATGPQVALSLDAAAVPSDIAPTVFRVVQESLTNVRRHAPLARRVTVDVAGRDHGVQVSVRDDGPPAAPPARRNAFGLDGLAERVAALGGRFSAGPATGGGWLVSAWIPVPGAGG